MAQETSRQHPIEIEGVFNVRGFGGYSSTLRPNCFTRDAILYRSGHLRDVTARGLEQIRDLGISTIIDLTNSGETSALFTDTPSSRDQGCRVLRFPLAKHGFSVQRLSDKYKRYLEEGEKAIAEGYLKLMADSHDVIRDILFFIRDNPNDVYLVHCAMGKDRTGIMFAILLSLSGVPDDVVAEEYSRSESSLEPALPGLAAAIEKVLPMSETDAQALERAKIVIKTGKEAMLLTLQMVEERFGGMVQYVNEHCGIEMEDIDRIQDILTYTC
ncbi:protein-tyrosine phosphatase-like protein [Aspergillus aurantiobrunneus]